MALRTRARDSRRLESGAMALKVGLVLVALVLASVAAVGLGLIPTGGHHHPVAGLPSDVPPPSGPGLILHAPPPAPTVLAEAASSPPVSVPRLKRHLANVLTLPGLGKHLAFAVSQLGDPAARWAYGAPSATPASTLKLLTTTAALSVLGPDHRFTTSVLPGSARGSIVLVGGGDPLLVAAAPTAREAAGMYPQPASLEDLATATAARLAIEGVRRVRLGYDASLFSGPAVNPRWPTKYVPENIVSPISALWVNEGRETAGYAERSANPALAAAEAFRTQLANTGIAVAGPIREQDQPPAARAPVAEVTSAPLEQIVQHILEVSDNEGAEVLLRQVAIAQGRTGSSVAGVTAVRSALTALGLDLRGALFYDASGLSRDDVLPLPLLLDALEAGAAPDHPELRGVITGLPVAGFSGSLGYRFDDKAADGLGYVRAKTGTLTGVHALAGFAMTRTGQALFFVAIADQVPVPKTLEARADLDRIAATLTRCGC